MIDEWQNKYRMLRFSRRGRVLTITLDNPDSLNAVGKVLHDELATVFTDAALDKGSDVIVLTGAGRAFSAGGDIEHMQAVVDNPDLFIHEAEMARRIVFSLLELEKPIVARINGHAVGLGATLALFCDVTFMAERAKIGDPHVAVGLVAGDGGAVIWPQLVGFNRAKEYLLTGELLDAATAERIGLVNHAVPLEDLDARVDAFCDKLVAGSTRAVRWTKSVVNMELKRIAHALMPAGMALETVSAHSADHAEAVQAFREKRPPVFSK
jgi:enoyl-CoA hydratase